MVQRSPPAIREQPSRPTRSIRTAVPGSTTKRCKNLSLRLTSQIDAEEQAHRVRRSRQQGNRPRHGRRDTIRSRRRASGSLRSSISRRRSNGRRRCRVRPCSKSATRSIRRIAIPRISQASSLRTARRSGFRTRSTSDSSTGQDVGCCAWRQLLPDAEAPVLLGARVVRHRQRITCEFGAQDNVGLPGAGHDAERRPATDLSESRAGLSVRSTTRLNGIGSRMNGSVGTSSAQDTWTFNRA